MARNALAVLHLKVEHIKVEVDARTADERFRPASPCSVRLCYALSGLAAHGCGGWPSPPGMPRMN